METAADAEKRLFVFVQTCFKAKHVMMPPPLSAGTNITGCGEGAISSPKTAADFLDEKTLALMVNNEVERAVLLQSSMYGFWNRCHGELIRQYPARTVDLYMTDALQGMECFLKRRTFTLPNLK